MNEAFKHCVNLPFDRARDGSKVECLVTLTCLTWHIA
jgi:hypothetical protein